MNIRHPMGALHSFTIKNIFYYKMDLRLFYFNVTSYNQSLQVPFPVNEKTLHLYTCIKDSVYIGKRFALSIQLVKKD